MNNRIVTFRDAELNSAPLRMLNVAGAMVKAVTRRDLPSLNFESICAKAAERAQSTNFGSDSYREPLQIYLDAVASEAEQNTFGRIAVQQMLIASLANRIKLNDWMQKNPAAKNEKIKKPWIILGLPRTGTSLLSILLGLNPLARPLLHWEAASPMPPPDLASAGEDPRIAHCKAQLDQLLKLNPALKAMHPFGAMLAEECTALFMYDLKTVGMETQAFVPSYGRWLAQADMRSTYDLHKQILQAFQFVLPTQQWVLKSPNHLWCVDTLLDTYPDARIIWTHRQPADVVTSLASLTNALQRPMTTRRDPAPVANDWNQKLQDGLSKAMAYDKTAKQGWCYHLRFDELMANPLTAIENIFAHFDEPLCELHRRRISQWVQQRPQNVFGRHQYDEKDFGWTRGLLEEQYQDYSDRYC